MRIRPLYVPVILLGLAGPALGQTPQAVRLQRTLDSLQGAGLFIGATAGVALPDGSVLALATGMSDTARHRPMAPSDRMLAGSVGKMFFAALALQLVDEGRLDLDTPIARWLGDEPWFDSLPNARTITVRQLMQHTSGLVRYEFNPRFITDLQADPYRTYTPVEELRYLFGADPPFSAGAGWDYSDTNYIVLTMILERILGGTAYDAIRERILEPLGLRGTAPSDRPDLPDLAQGYAGPQNPFGDFDAVVVDGRFALNPQFEWAGGGYASTTADLARLATAWYEGELFDSALVRHAVEGVPAPMLGPNVRYGLGVIVRETPRDTTWGHSGYFPGYLTEVRYYPAHHTAIAVQLNQNAPRRGPGAIVQALAAALWDQGGP